MVVSAALFGGSARGFVRGGERALSSLHSPSCRPASGGSCGRQPTLLVIRRVILRSSPKEHLCLLVPRMARHPNFASLLWLQERSAAWREELQRCSDACQRNPKNYQAALVLTQPRDATRVPSTPRQPPRAPRVPLSFLSPDGPRPVIDRASALPMLI